MDTNLKGLAQQQYNHAVRKNPYLPIIEAITNSLNSLEKSEVDSPTVEITFITNQQSMLCISSSEPKKVDAVVIKDNGSGFTNLNFESFRTIASTHKEEMGCKGLGRLSWLCAFQYATIKSNYLENGQWYCREFKFSPEEGCPSGESSPIEPQKLSETVIQLHNPQTPALSKKIFHRSFLSELRRVFTVYLINKQNIQIRYENEILSFDKLTLHSPKPHMEVLEEQQFSIYCVLSSIKLENERHAFTLCGHNRAVLTEHLEDYPREPLKIGEGQSDSYVYFYITSPYLDDNVNTTRDDFTFHKESTALDIDLEGPSLEAIKRMVTDYANTFAEKYIASAKEGKNRNIATVIQDYPHLQSIMPKIQNTIAYSDTSEKIALKGLKYQVEVAQEARTTIKTWSGKPLSKLDENQKQQLDKAMADITHENALQFGYYIAYRKVVLDLLDRCLKQTDFKGYDKENMLHQIICPMGQSHETLQSMEHNLWLLDERLIGKNFYSDMNLKKSKSLDSRKEPDLLLEKTIVLAENTSSRKLLHVSVVEFKRPNVQLTELEIKQIFSKYIDPLGEKTYSLNGQNYGKDDQIVYGYTILTIDESIEKILIRDGYHPCADRDSYYRYYEARQCLHYVIDWNRFLADAQARNEFFFKQLRIDQNNYSGD